MELLLQIAFDACISGIVYWGGRLILHGAWACVLRQSILHCDTCGARLLQSAGEAERFSDSPIEIVHLGQRCEGGNQWWLPLDLGQQVRENQRAEKREIQPANTVCYAPR